MSVEGQQRRFGPVPTMSGLPLIADIVASVGDGREGPTTDVGLFRQSTQQISCHRRGAHAYLLGAAETCEQSPQ
jgi:hypothetical protein